MKHTEFIFVLTTLFTLVCITTEKLLIVADCMKTHKKLKDVNECLRKAEPFIGNEPVLADSEAVREFKLCIIKCFSVYFGYPVIFISNKKSSLDVSNFLQQNNFKQYENVVFTNRSQLLNNLLMWKANYQKLFAVFCSTDCAVEVLHLALIADVIDKEYIWIVLSNDLSEMEVDLPETLISIQYEETPVTLKNNRSSTPHKEKKCSAYDIKIRKKHHLITANDTDDVSNFYRYHSKHSWTLMSSKNKTKEIEIDLRSVDHSYCNNYEVVPAVTILEPPFTMLLPIGPEPYSNHCTSGKLCFTYEHVGNTTARIPNCCYGYAMELLQKLEFDLNITADLYIVEDGLYGSGINGTWNGMIGDVLKGKADIAIAPLTIFEKRTKVVDITDPYMVSGVGLGTIAQVHQPSFFNVEVFAPISWSLWLCLFVLTIFCSMLLYFMEFFENGRMFFYSLNESFLYLMGIMFQRDMGGENPHYFGTRIVSISFAMVMLIVMSTYTAVLTANKVVHETELPIAGFKDEKITNPTEDFVYGTLADSGIYRMFGDSINPAWNRMYDFMRPYNFVNTQKAVSDLKGGKLDAIIQDYVVLQYFGSLERDCKLQIAGLPIDDSGYGICSSKPSGLKRKLNKVIQKYKDDGTLSSLQSKWFSTKCIKATVEEVGAQAAHVFGGLFLMIGTFLVVALLIFIIEILLHCINPIHPGSVLGSSSITSTNLMHFS